MTQRQRQHHLSRIVRRTAQTLSLALFLWLLYSTAFPLMSTSIPVDIFLRMDPMLAVGIPIIIREWLPALLPGFIVLALTFFVGRFFCGYVCPMGVTLDIVGATARADRTRRHKGRQEHAVSQSARQAFTPARLARIKYLVLAATLGAALLGVNLLFWDAPIQLITRFYTLIIDPIRLLLAQWGLETGQPLWQALDASGLSHTQLVTRRYDVVLFTGLLFAILFALEWWHPRFWCRCLCPAGALMALCAGKALWRRRVCACEHCGSCVRHCPTGAIAPDGIQTAHRECITCQTCVAVCPVQGVVFGIKKGISKERPFDSQNSQCCHSERSEESRISWKDWILRYAQNDLCGLIRYNQHSSKETLPSRRAFMVSTGAGLALGALHLVDLRSALDKNPEAKGLVQGPFVLRPPGALPENAFLARCVRCGQCMRACPTNGLQPAWIDNSLAAAFSPVLLPRRGPCEPSCNVCGQVCPVGAVTPLVLAQKHWARIGTAVVIPGRCLAFAMDKRCVVCQEVCPYGAIKLMQKPNQAVPVPVVLGHRCFGCGYCEHHCPVRVSAIVVEAFHALRLPAGSDYKAEGTARGYSLDPNSAHAPPEFDIAPDALPPGFTE